MNAEHRTVSRAVAILEFVARSDSPVPLSTLATHLGAPKSSVHGFVGGLVYCGYLNEASGGYRLGSGVHALLGPSGTSLPLLLGGTCDAIAEETGETVTVAVKVGVDSVVYVYTTRSQYEVCYIPRLRVRRPLLPTSSGKFFLANSSSAVQEKILARSPAAIGTHFRSEMELILASGRAFNLGETVPDVGAVAVGAYTEGRLLAAITVGGPVSRVANCLSEFGDVAQRTLASEGFGPLSGPALP